MPTVIFKGRVLPTWSNLTISQPIAMGWRDPIANYNGDVEVTITGGEVTAKCETNQFDENNFGHIYKDVFERAGVLVNLATFSTGDAMLMVFETITLPSGETNLLRIGDPTLGQHCTAFSLTAPSAMEILNLLMAEPPIHCALSDLNEALCFPNRTNINCARVVETIRNLIHPAAKNENRLNAWLKMQEVLNLGSDYVKFISKHSESHRHGNYERIDGETNQQVFHRTWKIMNRFLEYRKRGSQPLTPPDFPALV